MQLITSDKLGLLKTVRWVNGERFIEEQDGGAGISADLNSAINYVAWSGGFGGYGESEVTVCRENGLVESFYLAQDKEDNFINNRCTVSFITEGKCIYAKMLNSHHNIIYDYVRNEELQRGIMDPATEKLLFPCYNTKSNISNSLYEEYLMHDRLLVTVDNVGNVYILNWEGENESDTFHYYLEETDAKEYENSKQKLLNTYWEKYKSEVINKISFKNIEEIDNNTQRMNNIPFYDKQTNILKYYHYQNMLSLQNVKQVYSLHSSINVATSNEILANRLAIGSYAQSIKVLDMFSGKYIWTSDKLGTSLLRINTKILVKSLAFLNNINVNVLAAGTYDQKMVLFDLRCQSEPVYVYDYLNSQNVAKNKNNCFNYDYTETDRVFTGIAKEDYVIEDNVQAKWINTLEEWAQHSNDTDTETELRVEKNNTCKKKGGVSKKEKYTNKENQDVDEGEDEIDQIKDETKSESETETETESDILFTFNKSELKKINKEVLQLIQSNKKKEKKRKNFIKEKEIEVANEGKKKWKKKKTHALNESTQLKKKDIAEQDKQYKDEKKYKGKFLNKDKKDTNDETKYIIKKFGHKDYQHIHVSDNYGNIYRFEIITGNKLLHFIYKKQCVSMKIKYVKRTDEYLKEQKQNLYEFYKYMQEQNKSHWRNDLPVMWAKGKFDQFNFIFLKKVKIHNGGISSLVYHKKGSYLCSTSFERSICIIDVEKLKVLQKINVGNIVTGCLFFSKFAKQKIEIEQAKNNKNKLWEVQEEEEKEEEEEEEEEINDDLKSISNDLFDTDDNFTEDGSSETSMI